ncbi:CHAT domain-containing tetratricopeptide repeat protein [Acidisphaera sp. S103]|uniref:CHAT domain-containing protein n=1 Tax=Acidisphaera sp. S103 TaxID=1747223 RepID=UPI00131B9A8B|nr:CHAT domain-containing tetratricopeptide repeat protein [Acidisphaera sp. S103]
MTHRGLPLLLRSLIFCAVLVSCAVPSPDAYVQGGHGSAAAVDLGSNAAQENCSLQRGATDSQIYCGTYIEPAGKVVTPEQAADPTAFLAESGWRSVFDGRFLCQAPRPTTVFDSPAATLSCTRRQGGWPHVVLAVRLAGTLYVADGVKPIETILPRAIGVIAGRLPAKPAVAANGAGLATQREAAQAINIQGAGAIAEVERQMARGAMENRRGNYVAAEVAYRTAVSIQERLVGADNPALALPVAREGLQLSNQGRYPEADLLFARAERLSASPDQIDPVARPLVTYLRALDLLNRSKPQESLALLDQAERAFTAIVPPDALVPRSRSIVGARSPIELMAQAAADTSLVADQSSSDALNGLIEVRRYRAIALSALGRENEAESALKGARDLYAGRDPRLVARFFRTAGMSGTPSANGGYAISQLGAAVNEFALAQPNSAPLAETELLQAARLARQGNYADALPVCRAASKILESLKTGEAANLLTPCLHALSLEAAHGGQPVLSEMFALSQLARSGITSQQIALAAARLAEGARDPKVAAAIRQYDAASEELETLYRRRIGMASDKNNTAAVAAIDDAIRKAQEAQHDAGQARQEAAPGFDALVQDSVSASEVQSLLQPAEAIAVIVMGRDEGWTLLLRRHSISAGRIDGGATKIDKLVKRFRASMDLRPDNRPPPFDTDAAQQLYAAVLQPVADGLKGVTALTVAPSGSLLSVPFAALLTGSATAGDLSQAPFLIRSVAISHVPSAASFVNLRQGAKIIRATKPWFGMGDFKPPTLRQAMASFPTEACGDSARELASLPELSGARKELEVARQLLGADQSDQLLGSGFTAKNVMAKNLTDYRIIHFATHAILPGELRCQTEPAVLTSTAPDAPNASGGLLTASEIELMHLDAEMVILAACNTGGEGGSGAGESLSGLARSFFFAGARSLLVTHWDANDETTTYLTALFLQALRANPDAGPAMALALSQRRMLDESVGARAVQAHPYYWAVEALIGGRGATGATSVVDSGKQRAGG